MEQAEVHEPAHVLDETHVLAWLMPMASASCLYIVPSMAPTHSKVGVLLIVGFYTQLLVELQVLIAHLP